MKIDLFRKSYQNASFVTKFEELISENKNLLFKGLVGSAFSFASDAVIQKINGNHLFILPDKEAAIYFYNDLENIKSSPGGRYTAKECAEKNIVGTARIKFYTMIGIPTIDIQ